jgi:hypothetical protein
MDNTTCMYLSIGELECTKCYKGTYQPLSGSTSCDSCLVDTYNDDEGATECKSCPMDSTTQGSEGSTSSSSCHCSIGYWGIPGTTCTQDTGDPYISYRFGLLLNTTLIPGFFEEEPYLTRWSSNITTHIGVSSNRVHGTALFQESWFPYQESRYRLEGEFISNYNYPREITAHGMVLTMYALLSNNISIFGSEATAVSFQIHHLVGDGASITINFDAVSTVSWISGGLILALLLVLSACCYKPNKDANVRPFDLFVLILAIYDVISDIVFMSYLGSHDKLLYHFISSVTFFSISLVYNTVITIALVSGETRSDEFNKWMSKNKSFVLICIVAATNVGVLNIITSNIWGLALFGAGAFVSPNGTWSATPDSRGRLLLLALSSLGAMVEEIPSLVISISSTYVMGTWSFAASLSVSASVIGLSFGMAKGIMGTCILVRRHGCDCTSTINVSKSNSAFASPSIATNTAKATSTSKSPSSPAEWVTVMNFVQQPASTDMNKIYGHDNINHNFEIVEIPFTPDPSIASTPPFTPTPT